MNRHFQAYRAKYWKSHIFKTKKPIPTKCCRAIKTTNYASWVVQTRVKQIQRTAAILQRFDQSAQNLAGDAYWPSALDRPLKFWTFKNLRWPMTVVLKNQKRQYLRKGFTNRRKNWHGDAHWPRTGSRVVIDIFQKYRRYSISIPA